MHTGLDGGLEELGATNALTLGKALEGNRPGIPARTNAAIAQTGREVQGAPEKATPFLKGTGIALSAVSVADGYRTGGISGAAYSAFDAAIEYALSSTLVGAGVAIAYGQAGGSKALLSIASKSIAIQTCHDLAYGPAPLQY